MVGSGAKGCGGLKLGRWDLGSIYIRVPDSNLIEISNDGLAAQ
jgi:hypothetical protein